MVKALFILLLISLWVNPWLTKYVATLSMVRFTLRLLLIDRRFLMTGNLFQPSLRCMGSLIKVLILGRLILRLFCCTIDLKMMMFWLEKIGPRLLFLDLITFPLGLFFLRHCTFVLELGSLNRVTVTWFTFRAKMLFLQGIYFYLSRTLITLLRLFGKLRISRIFWRIFTWFVGVFCIFLR